MKKQTMDLLNRIQSITGDSTPSIEIFPDGSGGLNVHREEVVEFDNEEDMIYKIREFVEDYNG